MAFHLEGPWLSTTGKKKGKQKFRSSAEAQKVRELKESWEALQKKWATESKSKKIPASTEAWSPPKPFYRGANDPKIPSLPFSGAPCTKAETKVYTGTKVKGIATMHKSNAVPVFNDEQAVEISSMRR